MAHPPQCFPSKYFPVASLVFSPFPWPPNQTKLSQHLNLPPPTPPQAVSTLHQKFADAGNPKVEVLVTMGKQGSIFFAFGWEWDWPAAEDEHGLLPYETYRSTAPPNTPRNRAP